MADREGGKRRELLTVQNYRVWNNISNSFVHCVCGGFSVSHFSSFRRPSTESGFSAQAAVLKQHLMNPGPPHSGWPHCAKHTRVSLAHRDLSNAVWTHGQTLAGSKLRWRLSKWNQSYSSSSSLNSFSSAMTYQGIVAAFPRTWTKFCIKHQHKQNVNGN